MLPWPGNRLGVKGEVVHMHAWLARGWHDAGPGMRAVFEMRGCCMCPSAWNDGFVACEGVHLSPIVCVRVGCETLELPCWTRVSETVGIG